MFSQVNRHASSGLTCGIHAIHGDKPLIMGILNVTPDSFSDGGKYSDVHAALMQVERMLADGADMIDIGGESTRPGADAVSADEQIQRVVPVIAAIRQQLSSNVLISIDTTSSAVAKAALAAGANLINDISGGRDDQDLLALAAATDTPIILMHSQGKPKTMQDNPHYEAVVQEVLAALQASIDAALKAGIQKQNIVIDPGIGFGKRKQDNLDLLAHLEVFVATGYPVLLGASRKRFIGDLDRGAGADQRLGGSLAAALHGASAGVAAVRVHDVRETVQALTVQAAIAQAR